MVRTELACAFPLCPYLQSMAAIGVDFRIVPGVKTQYIGGVQGSVLVMLSVWGGGVSWDPPPCISTKDSFSPVCSCVHVCTGLGRAVTQRQGLSWSDTSLDQRNCPEKNKADQASIHMDCHTVNRRYCWVTWFTPTAWDCMEVAKPQTVR